MKKRKTKSGPYYLGVRSMVYWEICRGVKIHEVIKRQDYTELDGASGPDDPNYDIGNRPVAERRVRFLNKRFLSSSIRVIPTGRKKVKR